MNILSLESKLNSIDITELLLKSIGSKNCIELENYVNNKFVVVDYYLKNNIDVAYKNVLDILGVSFENKRASKLLSRISLELCVKNQENLEKCLDILKVAIVYSPGNPLLYYNTGLVLFKLDKLEDSLLYFKIGLENSNTPQDTYLNLIGISNVYSTVKCWVETLYYLNKANDIKPHDSECLCMLALGYTECRRTYLAGTLYNEAIKYSNNDIQKSNVYMNYGHLFAYNGNNRMALECYNNSIKYNPKNILAFQNKLLTMCYNYDGNNTVLYLQHILINKLLKPITKKITKHDNEILYLKKIVDDELKMYSKLNIGFVSGDFKDHPVSFFLERLMTRYNKSKFAFYCYSNSNGIPEWECNVDFKCISKLDTAQVVDTIKKDNIHILFDLSGHTALNRLDVFAMKPSKIQITYCGYPYTTGLSTMDYRITDLICDTGNSQQYYSEKLVYTKNCFLNYYIEQSLASKINFESKFNKSGILTLCCFNRLNKIGDKCVSVFNEILKRYSNTRIVFKTKGLLNTSVVDEFINNFDFSVRDRICIRPCNSTRELHILEYNDIDISLDTFPYSGTTTSCESLRMGVPVITLRGDIHFSNVSASLLHYSGIDDFIVNSQEEYINLIGKLLQRPKTFFEYLKKNTFESFSKMCSGDSGILEAFS